MAEIEIKRFEKENEKRWDDFVLHQSFNGTFLQSRAFLNYHGDRFCDHSLVFWKAGNIVAVIPAAEIEENGRKLLLSHCGSTFGGLVFPKNYNTIGEIKTFLSLLDEYLRANGFAEVVLKQTADIFCHDRNDLLFYLLGQFGYAHYDELSFALEFPKDASFDVVMNFSGKTRNLYKKSLQGGIEFKEFSSDADLAVFHQILTKSLARHDAKPVHSLEELMDLSRNRLPEGVRFYGAFSEGRMIAGSMIFLLGDVFHTQYLCADYDYLDLKPMDFLDGNLIQLAYKEGYRAFSFGISTEDHGKILNETLAKYKYGFGTNYYTNVTFYKELAK